jgi:hypothetical protein
MVIDKSQINSQIGPQVYLLYCAWVQVGCSGINFYNFTKHELEEIIWNVAKFENKNFLKSPGKNISRNIK